MKKTALIMAGGSGERFWPKSRVNYPKQFLSLTHDGKTMIQHTVERLLPLMSMSDIYIATNEIYKPLVLKQLPSIPPENILCEPTRRNTAPCIGLGAVHMQKKYEDSIMIVLPSDHLIKNNCIFANTLEKACEIAESDSNIVTIGISPNYPETGYGYIKYAPQKTCGDGYKVEAFVEKPCLALAQEYLDSGSYLWNSGMFVWKLSTILDNFKTYLPETYWGLMKIKHALGTNEEINVLEKEFSGFTSESIDYGIMEKAENIFTLAGNFGWDDVGSWLAVERICDRNDMNNVISGEHVITLDTQNCIIEGHDRLIAAIGLQDLIVVDSKDTVLICRKEQSNDIKRVIQKLKESGKQDFL